MFVKRYQRYYTAQVDERDCGVAALNMVLKYYHSDYSLAYLRKLAKTNAEGTTALGIVKAAEALLMAVSPIRTDMSLFEMSDLSFPFIVHVKKAEGILHYYVVFGKERNSMIIADPDNSVGISKMNIDKFTDEWSGVALFIVPTSSFHPHKEKKRNLLSFLPMVLKQRSLIISTVIASVMITLFSILGSYFFQAVIDTYIPQKMTSTLDMITCGLLVIYIFQAIFSYAENFLLTILGQRMSIDVTLKFIRHLYELPMSFFSTRKIGEIISRFSDASKIIDALASASISVFMDVWILMIMGAVLCIQNFRLFFIAFTAVPIYCVVVALFKRPFDRINQNVMENESKLSSLIIEDLNGMETLKSLTAEKAHFDKVNQQFTRTLKTSLKYSNIDQLQQSMKSLLKLTLSVIVLGVGTNLVVTQKLKVGQLLTFNALLAYFIDPLESIINLQTKIQSARVANTRLNEINQVHSEFPAKRSILSTKNIRGNITISHLNYKYTYGINTLNDVCLTISSKTKMTIVGMSGSGKTTLAKILVGFYPLESGQGQIEFNGTDLRNIDLKMLRKYIMYVPQEPVIFSGTIMDNLQMATSDKINQEQINNACEIAEIKADILNLPLGFDAELTEGGATLSGGQKQRIALARALLSPAEILVLDESTSSLDSITEHRIIDNLMNLKNRTIVFVAHRLNIAKRTDNIVVVDHGTIVENGSHEQLLKAKGHYYNLLKKGDTSGSR